MSGLRAKMDGGEGNGEGEARENESPLLFIYGSLMASQVLQALIHRIPPCQPGTLAGYHRYRIRERPYPAIAPTDGAEVQGLLLCGLSAQEHALLDFFEDDEYRKTLVQVSLSPKELHPGLSGFLPNSGAVLSGPGGTDQGSTDQGSTDQGAVVVDAFAYVYAQQSAELYGEWSVDKFLSSPILPDYINMSAMCREDFLALSPSASPSASP